MAVSKGRYKYSFSEGRKAENKFYQLMVARGNTCVKSSQYEDINKHIDFYVNDSGVDVKRNRDLEAIWLELENVKGFDGWLKGEAVFIVFDVVELKSFCFFEREKLLDYCLQFKEIAKDNTEYKKLYTRENRKDVLVKVKYLDIKHLQTQIISYE